MFLRRVWTHVDNGDKGEHDYAKGWFYWGLFICYLNISNGSKQNFHNGWKKILFMGEKFVEFLIGL